jgi:pimeloyl-ACP methyl ester carboxylesterase
MESPDSKVGRTFVLIHGVNHGGWCYDRVAKLLRSQGHRVLTPTLSGMADRLEESTHRPINLTTHINETLDLFESEALSDVVLCGHSYGGMVIGGVADKIPDKIAHLVYLDAVIPEDGKSMCDYVFTDDMMLQAIHAVGALGGGIMCPAPPAEYFNVNEADREMADRLFTPQPMASILEKIQIGCNADQIKNHTYIYGTNWGLPGIDAQYERAKTLPSWKVFEVESGHDVMLDAPVQLAEILNSLD